MRTNPQDTRKRPEIFASTEEKEVERFLTFLYTRYEYDFSHYSRAFLKRRILRRLVLWNLDSIEELQKKIARDSVFFEQFLYDMFISVTEMFRDPPFFAALKTKVIPYLKTHPLVKVWIAGCATGEEAYSIAILLKEAGMYNKSTIYATDISKEAISQARKGVYSTLQIKLFTENYHIATGARPFVDYYKVEGDRATFDPSLRKNIVFSDHNLVTDASFGQMHLILCRNVLIYFDRYLQNKTLSLLSQSLLPHGFLCLGSKEAIRFSDVSKEFESFLEQEKIFRKKLSLLVPRGG